MKKFFTLLFLAVAITGMSQPQRPMKHVILIRNNYTSAIKKISENSNITVVTKAGQKLSGRIVHIHADTIFFEDTSVRVSDIKSLVSNTMTSLPSMPGPFRHEQMKSGVEYFTGSPEKQIICPPESAYQNYWSYNLYVKGLIREVKKARSEEQNPLRETMNPLLGKNNVTVDTMHLASDADNLLSNIKVSSDSISGARHYNNFLKWNLTKLAHLEVSVAYERKIADQLTWETELSAIFGVQSADAHYTLQQPLYNYNGFSVTTYPKYYVISPTIYISAVFMYRYLWK